MSNACSTELSRLGGDAYWGWIFGPISRPGGWASEGRGLVPVLGRVKLAPRLEASVNAEYTVLLVGAILLIVMVVTNDPRTPL